MTTITIKVGEQDCLDGALAAALWMIAKEHNATIIFDCATDEQVKLAHDVSVKMLQRLGLPSEPTRNGKKD